MLNFAATLVLAASLFGPQNPAQPAPPAAAMVKEDPAVTALALKIYAQMRKGAVDEALMTPEMSKALSPAVLAQTMPVFDQLGDPTRLTLQSSDKLSTGTRWVYLAVFATAQLHVNIFVTTEGKVGGYALAP